MDEDQEDLEGALAAVRIDDRNLPPQYASPHGRDRTLACNKPTRHGKSIWWDEATRVPVLLRAPGISAGTDPRMISTVDLPATLLRVAGAEMRHPSDGRPLQDGWQRDGVLIESWDKKSQGNRRLPFTAIRGEGWVYIEAQGKAPQYYLLVGGESVDHYGELAADKQQRLAVWLADLRDCHGTDCG